MRVSNCIPRFIAARPDNPDVLGVLVRMEVRHVVAPEASHHVCPHFPSVFISGARDVIEKDRSPNWRSILEVVRD